MAALVALAAAGTAASNPRGKTTRQETIRQRAGTGFRGLVPARGEGHLMRALGNVRVGPKRRKRRRSLAFFVQLTDPQLTDEASPARVEFADPLRFIFRASWRPHDALGTQIFDQIVCNVNRNRVSLARKGPRKGKPGKRAKLQFDIEPGDLTNNQ